MKKTYRIALSGILLALACTLSYIESIVPLPLPLGAKPGLAGIVVMFAFMKIDFPSAATITVLKSAFVLLTRGFTASIMSASGGILSLAVMLMLFRFTKSSTVMISVCGAVTHNIGQIIAAGLIMGSLSSAATYSPILIIAGCLTGSLTGFLLSLILKSCRVPLKTHLIK
ncbi:MAG: Gx transporter family protein [Ruminococcus sp.]|nr:Gx transporter family protein [Ruminococcus sp.]